MAAFDQGDVVIACCDLFAGGDRADSFEAVSAPDQRRRRPAEQPGAGQLGDSRGIHRVVEVGMHRNDCFQTGDPKL